MKKLLLFCALALPLLSLAQPAGKIIYQEKINLHRGLGPDQEEHKAMTAKVTPEPTTSAQPAPVFAHTTLEDVVDRALPVASEPVELSAEIPLHGEAVGHKRLILHPAHDDIPKPKFVSRKPGGRRTVSAAASVDRELREVVRNTMPQRPELTSRPAPHMDTTAYDVVQPEASGSGSIEGALERALRTLAGEKQS